MSLKTALDKVSNLPIDYFIISSFVYSRHTPSICWMSEGIYISSLVDYKYSSWKLKVVKR